MLQFQIVLVLYVKLNYDFITVISCEAFIFSFMAEIAFHTLQAFHMDMVIFMYQGRVTA